MNWNNRCAIAAVLFFLALAACGSPYQAVQWDPHAQASSSNEPENLDCGLLLHMATDPEIPPATRALSQKDFDKYCRYRVN